MGSQLLQTEVCKEIDWETRASPDALVRYDLMA